MHLAKELERKCSGKGRSGWINCHERANVLVQETEKEQWQSSYCNNYALQEIKIILLEESMERSVPLVAKKTKSSNWRWNTNLFKSYLWLMRTGMRTKMASQYLGKKIPPDGICFSLMLWGRILDIPAGPILTLDSEPSTNSAALWLNSTFATRAYGTQQCYGTSAHEWLLTANFCFFRSHLLYCVLKGRNLHVTMPSRYGSNLHLFVFSPTGIETLTIVRTH